MSAVPDHKRRVYAIRDLPTLPVIAQKVLRLANDDEASAEKLTALISSDQALSVKVLALANSAYYGYRAKIGTVRHAVIVIGTNMLKQLSLSVLVCGTIGRGGKDRTEFWKHSFATATAAALIARRTGMSDGELAFMAGLIHDIGKMIIDTYFPDEHGMQHTEVGAWMGERWQLPQPLIDAIAFHHSLEPEHLALPIVACVQAADACAKVAMKAPEESAETVETAAADADASAEPPAEILPDIPEEVLKSLKLKEKDVLEIVRELRSRRAQIDKFLV
jgi:putative nucleotidyltransferase with HDIG domain